MPKKRKIPQATDDNDYDVWDHVESNRRMFAFRRKLFTLLNVWKVCPRAICQRGHKCLGDIEMCSRVFLPLPEPARTMMAKIVEARNAGLSGREMIRFVEAEMKRCDARGLGET